jgi:hypothetical protein
MNSPFVLSARIQKQSASDIAKRMVWGIATSETEGPDHQGDIVDYRGSLRAFKQWEKNVREMHTSKAVGRCVSVIPLHREKKILVGVRVSDGAPDTWKKVLDGTLRAFSIGGYPIKEKKRWNEKSRSFVNYITDYNMTELSLCDSPANPDCQVTLLTKRNNQKLASDVLAELQGETMNKETQEAAKTKFVGFAKSLKDGDEMVVVRKSDLSKAEDGTITMKADVAVETFTKAEAEDGVVSNLDEHEDGNEDDGHEEDGEEVAADLNAVAESLLEAHDVIHDLAGQECSCHGGDEGAEEDHESPEGEEDEVGKTLHARWRKSRMALRKGYQIRDGQMVPVKKKKKGLNKKKVAKMLRKAMSAQAGEIATALDLIAGKVGVTLPKPAIRKGGGEAPVEGGGTPDAPGIGKTAGGILVKADMPSTDRAAVDSLAKTVRDLTTETRALIAKRDGKVELTPTEQTRILVVGDDLQKAKIAFTAATGLDVSQAFVEA